MGYFNIDLKTVFKELKSDENGLTEVEAKKRLNSKKYKLLTYRI